MKTVLVSYELKTSHNYEAFIAFLERHNSLHVMESTWVIRTASTFEELAHDLHRLVHSEDKVFAVDVTGQEVAWSGISERGSNWLHDLM